MFYGYPLIRMPARRCCACVSPVLFDAPPEHQPRQGGLEQLSAHLQNMRPSSLFQVDAVLSALNACKLHD
eukprot:830502-Pleurochrysis_carterae.AAC.2